MPLRTHSSLTLLILATCLVLKAAPADRAGHQPEVKVSAATRIDWVFALSNQSPAEPPADWLPGYDSTAQTYELYVPKSLKKGDSPGLILFISPGDRSTGLESLRKVCDEQKLIFASPHGAGNNTDSRKRIRIVLDVLDDLRREYRVDPDRTYIGGFSGGGRMACAIGFSLPEYFGGVIPVCAAGDLREESWLRQRVIDRLSVAHLTGETDFNRGEVERFRGAMLANVGVRSKVWVAPKMGHAIPATSVFEEAIVWLDAGLPVRRKLAKDYPGIRASQSDALARDELAKQLLAEGKLRLGAKAKTYSGLM
jgi:predicted esterase